MKDLFFYNLPGRKPTGRNCASRIKNKKGVEIISKNLVNARRTFQNIDFFFKWCQFEKRNTFLRKKSAKNRL